MEILLSREIFRKSLEVADLKPYWTGKAYLTVFLQNINSYYNVKSRSRKDPYTPTHYDVFLFNGYVKEVSKLCLKQITGIKDADILKTELRGIFINCEREAHVKFFKQISLWQ